MEFKPGDRIVFLGHPRIHLGVDKGELGTVLHACSPPDFVSVRWDVFKYHRHTCDGLCETGYGWNVDSRFIAHFIDDLGDFSPNLAPGSITDLLGG